MVENVVSCGLSRLSNFIVKVDPFRSTVLTLNILYNHYKGWITSIFRARYFSYFTGISSYTFVSSDSVPLKNCFHFKGPIGNCHPAPRLLRPWGLYWEIADNKVATVDGGIFKKQDNVVPQINIQIKNTDSQTHKVTHTAIHTHTQKHTHTDRNKATEKLTHTPSKVLACVLCDCSTQ